MEDVLRKKLAEAAERLKSKWQQEAVAAPLNAEGDEKRRLAAFKHQTMDELLREIDLYERK